MDGTAHQLSLQCYLDARRDPTIPRSRYRDLEDLIGRFRLADSGPPAEPMPSPERFAFRSQAPHIVIVDDEALLTELLKERLVDWGYPAEAIQVLASGDQAISYAGENAVGIAFVDLKLTMSASVGGAYTSGLQVIKAIKQTSPGAKVVFISGYATYEMVRKATLELGASYFLRKPFSLNDVLIIAHWALERLLGSDVKRIISTGSSAGPDSSTAEKAESVLVVDDDVPVAESIAFALRSLGYRAVAAGGADEAMDRIGKKGFDAVLLDVRMPGTDGIEVLRRIRRGDRRTVVLMLTAVEDEKVAQEAIRMGAYDFLIKPCDINLLQLTLEYAFARHGTRERLP